MSSLVTAVFKATIGLLVNKGRDVAAERLKEGDVTDQRFRGLIVRELDDIKSKVDGLARKDLLSSFSSFKEGIEFLYKVFEKVRGTREDGSVTTQRAVPTASSETLNLAKGIEKLELTDLDESTTRALTNAKGRFKEARRKATDAFANEALELSDRVLAMQYRVMATILETVDNPDDAFPACRVCIEELHCLPAVKEYFKVELEKGLRARFSKHERRAIISAVCHVNRVIHDVTLIVARRGELLMFPGVDAGEEKIDPLRDARIFKVLQKKGTEHCCVTPWSFGQEGEEEHELKHPLGFATNTHGRFIVADSHYRYNKRVLVFNQGGNFLLSFNPQTDDNTEFGIRDIATDVNSNTYVLVQLKRPGAGGYKWEWEVQVFDKTADLKLKFLMREGFWEKVAVSNTKVLVLGWTGRDPVVDVYKHDGEFVCSFGKGILRYIGDITAANDGQVMIIETRYSCIHIFTEEGTQLSKFKVKEVRSTEIIACHPTGDHFVVASVGGDDRPNMGIYTKHGEFVRRIQIDDERIRWLWDITVTTEGQIAAVVEDVDRNCKVIVL